MGVEKPMNATIGLYVRYIDLDELRFVVGAICLQLIAFGIEIEGNPREFFVGRFKIRQNNLELALNTLFSLSLVNVEVETLRLQCQETLQPYRYLGLHLNIKRS